MRKFDGSVPGREVLPAGRGAESLARMGPKPEPITARSQSMWVITIHQNETNHRGTESYRDEKHREKQKG
jgi:hypothetical protein